MKVSVPVAFRSPGQSYASVCLCPVEVPEITSSEVTEAAFVPGDKYQADRTYVAWDNRLWRQGFRGAPETLGQPDQTPVTAELMHAAGIAMPAAIREFRRLEALGTRKTSLLKGADAPSVRQAFTSRFQQTHFLTFVYRVNAADPEQLIDGQVEAMDAAALLGQQSVLIDGELWTSTIGPTLAPQIYNRPDDRICLTGDHFIPQNGLAISIADAETLVNFREILPHPNQISSDTEDRLARCRFDPELLKLGRIDDYNAAGLGWITINLLHHNSVERLPRHQLECYIELRNILINHAERVGIPAQKDFWVPYESSQTDFPEAGALWHLLENLEDVVQTRSGRIGPSNLKTEVRWAFAHARATGKFDALTPRQVEGLEDLVL